jgi:hypothetical protein
MRKIWLLFTLLAATGCVTANTTRYNKEISYPATDPAAIQIFQKKPAQVNFIEIGEVTVDGAANWDQVNRIFKIRAAELGGNAVYVYKITEVPSVSVSPHECYFYHGFDYAHGHHYPMRYHYPHAGGYFPSYYYCYGYNDVNVPVFLNVVGIIIRNSDGQKAP